VGVDLSCKTENKTKRTCDVLQLGTTAAIFLAEASKYSIFVEQDLLSVVSVRPPRDPMAIKQIKNEFNTSSMSKGIYWLKLPLTAKRTGGAL
jgi:hypothetical protein